MQPSTPMIEQGLRITPEEVRTQEELGKPVTILDARSAKGYDESRLRIRDDVRVNPDAIRIDASLKDQLIVAYCT